MNLRIAGVEKMLRKTEKWNDVNKNNQTNNNLHKKYWEQQQQSENLTSTSALFHHGHQAEVNAIRKVKKKDIQTLSIVASDIIK